MPPCNLADRYQRFEEMYSFYRQDKIRFYRGVGGYVFPACQSTRRHKPEDCIRVFAEEPYKMEALRQTNQHGKMTTSTAGGNTVVHTQQGQGLAALLVMIAVLCFILAYCCWGAPCCRSFCRRRCCSCCHVTRTNSQGDIEALPSDIGLSVDRGMVATPTIILLPYGRMLVVDGSVFAQLQADTSGLDLIELGENIVQAQQRATPTVAVNSLAGSTPSILDVDSETNSKDGCISPTLDGFPPPTYESIFGSESMTDLPPSYDEILQQLQAHESSETVPEEYQPGEIRESRV